MPRGYRGGCNPNRDSDGQYTTPGGAGRPSANRGTTQVYKSRDGKTTVTKDIRGTFSMKRNGVLTGATVTSGQGRRLHLHPTERPHEIHRPETHADPGRGGAEAPRARRLEALMSTTPITTINPPSAEIVQAIADMEDTMLDTCIVHTRADAVDDEYGLPGAAWTRLGRDALRLPHRQPARGLGHRPGARVRQRAAAARRRGDQQP